VLPSDKSFSVPLFLSLVHGGTDYAEMQVGLDHLKDSLAQQSRRRENLVRNHFGLFVQCADGLEWLKAYRKGGKNVSFNTYLMIYKFCFPSFSPSND
jgi:hypothetical protein